MPKYAVLYGYRTDDGLNYSMSTHHDEVVVEAPDVPEARQLAIDAVYAKHARGELGPASLSHVTIKMVKEQGPDQ